MLKVYDIEQKIKKNNWEEFKDTSIFSHYYLFDDEKVDTERIIKCETFEELKRNTPFLYNVEFTTTLFTREPMLKISYDNGTLSGGVMKVTEKNFKPMEIKIFLKECNLSLSRLANVLSANEFCEYLKSRGMNKI